MERPGEGTGLAGGGAEEPQEQVEFWEARGRSQELGRFGERAPRVGGPAAGAGAPGKGGGPCIRGLGATPVF